MKRLAQIVVLSATLATALVVVAPAGSANECEGLQVCVPVAGPWVVVPSGGGMQRPQVEYQLTCPRRYVVGGLDAELSERGIEVSFSGRLGSPVNPGITTARSVVFRASYVGDSPRSTSFRPYIGCVPAAGGGPRVPTALAIVPPGNPTVRRVKTLRVRPGNASVSARCLAGEHLVASSHAFGFFTRTPPSASLAAGVTGTRAARDGRVVVRVQGDAELGGVRAVVQVHAVCARAR
ncbi:MAG: hypothetical protein WD015_07415 [Gaiellaceae bacterium]